MKVLGLGDNVFDIYQNVGLSFPGGNALNVSVNAAKLKYESSYFGNFADDRYGYDMKAILNHYQVDTSHCYTIKNSSTKKCIENFVDGDRQFIKNDLGKNWAGTLQIKPSDYEYLNSFDIILTSCNAKIEDELHKLGKIKGIVVFDFGEKEKYRHQEYFDKICPYIDFAQFSLSQLSLEEINQFVTTFPYDIPILVTRGNQPPLVYDNGKVKVGINNEVHVVDTMGAGDAFVTALTCYLVEQGWKKNEEIRDEWIEEGLKKAANYASDICMIQGGIGHPYECKEVRAVIFDMDGVIVDSEIHWFKMFNDFISKFGKTLKDEDKKEFYGCSIEKELEILSRYIDGTTVDIPKLWKEYGNQRPIYYKKYLMNGVRDLLQYLKSKKIKIAIASSSSLEDIHRMIKECCLENIFDEIVSGQMFERSKPDPEVYNYTVDLLNIPRENIFVIEDSTHGLQAATAAGLQVLALRNKAYSFDLGKALMIFDTHKEILDYLKYVVMNEGEKE